MSDRWLSRAFIRLVPVLFFLVSWFRHLLYLLFQFVFGEVPREPQESIKRTYREALVFFMLVSNGMSLSLQKMNNHPLETRTGIQVLCLYVLVISQRHLLNELLWEVPSVGCHDTPDENRPVINISWMVGVWLACCFRLGTLDSCVKLHVCLSYPRNR